MYAISQRELYNGWKTRLKYLPILTFLGMGVSANNTKAVIEGMFNKKGTFHRTPKFGIERGTDDWEGKKYRLNFPVITIFLCFRAYYHAFYPPLLIPKLCYISLLGLFLFRYKP